MIDEAIEILKREMTDENLNIESDFGRAHKLGIEALELYYELRGCTAIDVEDIPSHLPSEGEKSV